ECRESSAKSSPALFLSQLPARKSRLNSLRMSVRGRAVLSGLAVTVLFALPLLPEIVGARRLVFRDAQITHWPWRRGAVRAPSPRKVPFANRPPSPREPLFAHPHP